jgi:hypothetical protein
MRKSTIYLIATAAASVLLCFFFFIVPLLPASGTTAREQSERTHLVQSLHITDLCLFTEASYTRHLSQSDRFAAFQDHPLALEHFPSGSLTSPPETAAERAP